MHFKRNLGIGFGISLIILLASTVASYMSITGLLSSAEQVSHTHRIISDLDGTLSVLKDAETGQRGFLLTGRDKFLKPYAGAYDSAIFLIRRVKAATPDNALQQIHADTLQSVITKRIRVLDSLIERKKRGDNISVDALEDGKFYMDSARALTKLMIDEENRALNNRNASLQSFQSYVIGLILFAAAIAVIITVIFYLRVRQDFETREKLAADLKTSEKETTRRIEILKDVANRISSGDYAVRVAEEQKDSLGSLGDSVNNMAESLQDSFELLRDKEWVQSGLAQLSELTLGQQDVQKLTQRILDFVVGYTSSEVGALYYLFNQTELRLTAGYGLSADQSRRSFHVGEGIVGQCALTAKAINVQNIPEGHLIINFASAALKPVAIIAVPVFNEGKVTGVLELASLKNFTPNEEVFLNNLCNSIGIIIDSSIRRARMQELLEETQTQAEELQSQHAELEQINAELEIKSEKLQGSEEELKVQQEELLQANKELEERASLLEDKNQQIIASNIQIEAKAEELAISSRYKSEFLANMSHELRTPLNSILLLSGLMAENGTGKLESEEVEYARVIQSSGNGLLSLIDEILDLSKIESGKMDLLIEQTAIADVVRNMQDLFGVFAREKELNFSVEVSADVPEFIETDKLRLEQILKNLISNAFKFTPKQGSVNLMISANGTSLVRFAVEDTGIGIPEDKQQLVFEAFQQADGSTRRKYGGTGLGLSISRELSRLLGGEINLKSVVGEGSEFSVLIPAKRPEISETEPAEEVITKPFLQHTPELVLMPEPDKAEEVIADDRHSIKPGDRIILIVEDDLAFAKILLDFTRQNGYKGIVVVKGDEGISFARYYRPTGVLLDLQLPVKNGWEVIEMLKADPQTRHIPVHMMSAQEGRRESMIRGAVDFINKPVALEQLKLVFARIEEVLNRGPKKVLIVEENNRHAQALSYYLETSNVKSEIRSDIAAAIDTLTNDDVDCVILDMQMPDSGTYEILEQVKESPGLEDLPIIIFTGKYLSRAEEARIRQYADSIVVKTAHSYQRILDEVSLFMHVVEENQHTERKNGQFRRLGMLNDVLRNKTILIADDDVRNIFSLTKALENYKMNVVSATDGREALEKLESIDIDLVLIDMMMPELDGYDTTRLIRKHPKFKTLPVLALTAKSMAGDREKCIQAGASDYISKPVDIDQLLSLLRVWLYEKQFSKI
jgi:signal transduction histidine kinase/CheY-like chemotaxis protein/CHASE3 domain sensor protein/HAMP domain-containing protein